MKKKEELYYIIFFLTTSVSAHNDRVFHSYLWANYNHFSGKLTSAHNWYKSLFTSHCTPYTYKGYIHFLFDTNQHKKIIELIPSLDKRFENDASIQLIFAIALEKNKQIKESDERLIKLNTQFKTNSDILLRTAQVYIRRKEPENALLAIDAFLNNSPRKANNFIFYFLKSQIHVQLSQLPEALKSITTCIDMHPRFDKSWLLFATLHEQHGEIQKALQGYGEYLELSGGNTTVEKHLFSLMLQYKTNEQHAPFHKTYLDLASKAYNQKNYRAALNNINNYLALQNDNYEALVLKIHILAHLNDIKQITQLVSQQCTKDTDAHALWAKNIYLLHHHNIPKTSVISMLQTLAKTHSNNYWYSLYAADLYLRLHKSQEAISALETIIPLCQDPLLNAKLHHQIGLLYYETNDYDKMLTHLEKGYALNNSDAHLNNTLAYYWATKGKDLQKAHSFFDKIDATQKTNPYFLDTHALILYKQQDYTKAQEILEPLQHNQNATMLLHLAKTYYKLNNKEKARTISTKATYLVSNAHEQKKLQKLQTLLSQ